MNNVVDRVPTEVLANGAVRWEQFDGEGNSLGYVYLKRADEPSVVGTPLNKVLFDSIQLDIGQLNSNKLNVSDKATAIEAKAGTNDTKYMTPFTTKEAISQLCKITNYTIAFDNTNHSLDNLITTNTIFVEVEGYADEFYLESRVSKWFLGSGNYANGIKISKEGISAYYKNNENNLCTYDRRSKFKLTIDVKNKLFCMTNYHGSSFSQYVENNGFNIIFGTIQSNSIGGINPGTLDSGAEGNVVIRVYDSPDTVE